MSEIAPHSLTGAPYEIGLQLGRVGADAVHGYLLKTSAWREIAARRGDPRLCAMERLVEERFPDYARELRGLADGLGLPFAEVFAWNCRGDLWAMAPDGCTTVQVPGVERQVIAHNEDGLPGFSRAGLMVRVEATGAKPFVSFAYPGSIPGHTFALTGAGLVQAVNNVRVTGASVGVPRMVLGRAVLDAPTIDGAITLLREAPRAGGFHMSLGQRGDRRIVSVEFLHGAISVAEVTRRSVHANHLIHPALAEKAQIMTESSASRQRRGDALVEAGAEPLAILRDQADAALPILRRAPDDPDVENTLATALFSIGSVDVACDVFAGGRQHPCLHIDGNLHISPLVSV
jgi:hypothetical protein